MTRDEFEKVNPEFLCDIRSCLSQEYGSKELNEFLGKSIFTETENEVIVMYANGVKDTFKKVQPRVKLVHESEVGD